MLILHFSDLHIGLRLLGRDMAAEQRHVLSQAVRMTDMLQPGAVVIAGDIYDRAVPGAEAVALFDWFLQALTDTAPHTEIMIISGNHDSPVRLNAFRGLLKKNRVHMIGLPPQKPGEHMETITLRDECGSVKFYLLPFVRPGMVRPLLTAEGLIAEGEPLSYERCIELLLAREQIDTGMRNVLVSHQFYLPEGCDAGSVERADSEICTVGNVDAVSARVLSPFDYAALGHIHKPMSVGRDTWRYCGTPLACSVSEAGQQKGAILVHLQEKGKAETVVMPFKPLHPVRVEKGTLAQVTQRPSEDLVSVVLTDPADLDVFDMRDRLRAAFPNLLEIRREGLQAAVSADVETPEQLLDPYGLCCAFLGQTDPGQQALLRELLNDVQGDM